MVSKCANSWCSAIRHNHEGKLFRLDIDLENMAGGDERKTEYIWLCACCVLMRMLRSEDAPQCRSYREQRYGTTFQE